MPLDASTLTFAGGLVTLCSSLFLLVYWLQDRQAWSAFWWAMASFGLGTGIILLSLHDVVPFLVSVKVAPQILNLAAALAFAAAWIFNRGSINPYRLAGAVALWLTTQAVAGIFWPEQLAVALGIGISGGVYAAAAVVFWQGRGEPLRGRKPMIAILVLHATALMLAAAQFALAVQYSVVPAINFLGIIHFVGLVYSLGVTLLLPMMLKGRTEEKYKQAALIDPLTGLANRRAFMDRAQRMLDRHVRDGQPFALLAFDLDRFKAINDIFGHAMGDRVLRIFADVLLATLRPIDFVARVGGEEFVAIASGADTQASVAIANRIRDAFQRVALFVDGQRTGATVSVGIASSAGRPNVVGDMLAQADAALYSAKAQGRNRVVLANGEPGRLDPGNVVRLA